jgi:hypothetical protein
VVILEQQQVCKEGNFTPKCGYLCIAFLTNLSQCWALRCLIFFQHATKTELRPMRPVGKFLSVKALAFFTLWQSVFVDVLCQMDLMPHCHSGHGFVSRLLSEEDARTLDEQGGSKVLTEWTSEDACKIVSFALKCLLPPLSMRLSFLAVEDANGKTGRDNKSSSSGATNASSASCNVDSHPASFLRTRTHSEEDDDLMHHPMDAMTAASTDDEDDGTELDSEFLSRCEQDITDV